MWQSWERNPGPPSCALATDHPSSLAVTLGLIKQISPQPLSYYTRQETLALSGCPREADTTSPSRDSSRSCILRAIGDDPSHPVEMAIEAQQPRDSLSFLLLSAHVSRVLDTPQCGLCFHTAPLFNAQEVESGNPGLHAEDGVWPRLRQTGVFLHPEVRTMTGACREQQLQHNQCAFRGSHIHPTTLYFLMGSRPP